MAKLTTERLEKRIKNCIEVGNGCVMLPVSVAEELLAYRKTVNHLLDNDGSRGKFSAVQSYDAREDLERLLASIAQQNEPQNIPENIPAQPVSNPYKFLGERAKYRVIIEGFSNSRSVDFEACSQEEAEEIGRDIFHEECNYGVERLESIPAQESE